jgi:tRNA 2-thiouridine synthesizing protein A
MKTVDTRGLSCPQPVIMVTREIVGGEKKFEVLVDTEASFENVTRLLENKDFKFSTEEKGDHKVIKAEK